MDYTKIVGANGARRKNDFYPTPPEATRALMDFLERRYLIRPGDHVWECAAGDGDMVRVLEERYFVQGTDIREGIDFLETEIKNMDERAGIRWIITNPPFTLAEQFIRHANELGVPFAFLLKSQYWHSGKRLRLFEEITPRYVCPLTWRPDFTGQGNSLMDMCWVIWMPGTADQTSYIPMRRPGKKK